MSYITLAVTEAVIRQVESSGQENERQIAIVDSSTELRRFFDTASRRNKIPIRVCGVLGLSVGDTHAIWAAHQVPGLQSEDFKSFYELLARRPEMAVKFDCD